MTEPVVLEETIVRPKRRPREDQRAKKQPPYAVVLHNDDINTFDFVIATLRKVFGYSTSKAGRLTLAAHMSGQCRVWTGPLEIAELKADQVRACGPDPDRASHGACQLKVTIEPLPGE